MQYSRPSKWTYNNTEDGIWNNDDFETKQEAVRHGIKAAKKYGWSKLFVGKIETVKLNTYIDADEIIEIAAELLDDVYPSDFEHGLSWSESISKEDSKELSMMLQETFEKWLEKTNNYPTSYTIIDVEQEEIILGKDEL